jgi:hypothetical protein
MNYVATLQGVNDPNSLALTAGSGTIQFTTSSCNATDLCAMAQDLAAIRAKFGN